MHAAAFVGTSGATSRSTRGGRTQTCVRRTRRSAAEKASAAADDDGWGSWASYREEMRERLQNRFGVDDVEQEAPEEVAAHEEEDTSAAQKKDRTDTSFWSNTFFREPDTVPDSSYTGFDVDPTGGFGSERGGAQYTSTFNSWNGGSSYDQPNRSSIFEGGGVRLDFGESNAGRVESEWSKQKQEAYSRWEDDRGYYKRTRYSFKDEYLYDDDGDNGEWQTKVDYEAFGRIPHGGRRRKMGVDLFSLLGVAAGATKSEIQRAYRNLARQYHPDLNPNSVHAAERMSQISFAYSVLKDPEMRLKYESGQI